MARIGGPRGGPVSRPRAPAPPQPTPAVGAKRVGAVFRAGFSAHLAGRFSWSAWWARPAGPPRGTCKIRTNSGCRMCWSTFGGRLVGLLAGPLLARRAVPPAPGGCCARAAAPRHAQARRHAGRARYTQTRSCGRAAAARAQKRPRHATSACLRAVPPARTIPPRLGRRRDLLASARFRSNFSGVRPMPAATSARRRSHRLRLARTSAPRAHHRASILSAQPKFPRR